MALVSGDERRYVGRNVAVSTAMFRHPVPVYFAEELAATMPDRW